MAKRIAALIDVKRRQLLFSLKVYDISAERKENLGIDSGWLNGSRGIYDIVVPPFTETTDFLKNFKLYTLMVLLVVCMRPIYWRWKTNKASLVKQTATLTLISDKEVKTEKLKRIIVCM